MTVLRSREIITSIKSQSSSKTPKRGFNIEPTTPAKALEPSNHPSRHSMPSSWDSARIPEPLGLGIDPVSGSIRRRSLRLISRASSEEITGNVLVSSGKRKSFGDDNDVNERDEFDQESEGLELGGKRVRVSERVRSKRRVSGELGTGMESEEKGGVEEVKICLDELAAKVGEILIERDVGESESPSDSGGFRQGSENVLSAKKGKGNRKFDVDVEFSADKSGGEGEREKGVINLRSGKEIPKRSVEGMSSGFLGVENGKEDNSIDENERQSKNIESGIPMGKRKYSRKEKGKGKSVDKALTMNVGDRVIPELDINLDEKIGNSFSDAAHWPHSMGNLEPKETENSSRTDEHLEGNEALQDEMQVLETNARANTTRRFRDIARRNASRFAHFSSQVEEENNAVHDGEREVPPRESDMEMEDWPGPFSTAMKIIRDRKTSLDVQQENSSLDKSDSTKVIWVPRKDWRFNPTRLLVPSLLDLCTSVLLKNADAIASLDGVPDILRHKLCHLLCDSRRMKSHHLDLLVRGSPTEIRIRDCSWLTEEQFTMAFQGCEFSNLMVLQLDQCGRCLPDYTLFDTLARSSNNLPALTTISVKGACRLSDGGLHALVSSAPRLRSINLSQCSLVTSCGIAHLADALGSVLRELYLDDCQSADAILILPSLAKLDNLEVLSLSGIESVSDDFLTQFVAIRGHHLKELNLTYCTKLTDSSMKVIAEYCTGLRSIDLSFLCKLTDSAIGYLANGCQAIQTLKLCRNSFSDEAIAAYLETCGGPLKELSLNNVNKVAYNTAISLAKRSSNLVSLDLSWCRNLTNEALGLIVDSCLSLEVLKLFGCTQISNVFVNGHSNPKVKIIGLKMSPILKYIKVPELQVPLHYSSVPSST